MQRAGERGKHGHCEAGYVTADDCRLQADVVLHHRWMDIEWERGHDVTFPGIKHRCGSVIVGIASRLLLSFSLATVLPRFISGAEVGAALLGHMDERTDGDTASSRGLSAFEVLSELIRGICPRHF